jgi:hypothetical protein
MPILISNIPFIPKRKRAKNATPTPTPLQVVGVENVNYDEPVLSFTLVFNTTAEEPLVADALDAAKWSAVYQGGGGFFCESASVGAFDRVDLMFSGTPGPGGASTVSYSNDPSDVSDSLGRQLAAFEGLPL